MAKPQEKTASTAVRPIAPPPLSQHLRELASRPHAWAVIARNLIPVVGIYGFGWSAALAVFNYWFDGLTALAAIVAALIPRALRETQPKSVGAMSAATNLVRGVVTWIFLVGIVLTTVRAKTNSVAAGVLIHMAYNGTITVAMFAATDGFRHLEKLNQ